MASGDRLYFRADSDMREQVDEYKRKHGFEDRSKATRKLVEVGLREQRNPLVWRLKTKVVDWASMLAIAAIVSFLTGATTTIISVTNGAILSLALLIMASVLLATFEFARVALAINEVGIHVRKIVQRVKV